MWFHWFIFFFILSLTVEVYPWWRLQTSHLFGRRLVHLVGVHIVFCPTVRVDFRKDEGDGKGRKGDVVKVVILKQWRCWWLNHKHDGGTGLEIWMTPVLPRHSNDFFKIRFNEMAQSKLFHSQWQLWIFVEMQRWLINFMLSCHLLSAYVGIKWLFSYLFLR